MDEGLVDGVGIEVGAAPFEHLGMAFVVGFGHGFEVLGIAPGTADIFGRTSSFG